MPAVNHNIIIDQGETYQLTLTYADVNDDPVDLTGFTARMMLRTDFDAASPTLSLTHLSGIALGGAAGTIVVTISATQTAALVPGTYVYDLEIENGGVVKKLIRGRVEVRAEATK